MSSQHSNIFGDFRKDLEKYPSTSHRKFDSRNKAQNNEVGSSEQLGDRFASRDGIAGVLSRASFDS